MTANYLLPAGTVNNRTAYFYADTTNTFGPLVKTINDQVLVIIDYTTVLAGHVINTFNFTSDAETNPNLVLTDPLLNVTGTVLSFLLSGGIDGQQYNITIATEVVGSTTPRDDVLTVNLPSKSACEVILPPMVGLLSGDMFVGTNIRYFWGPNPPSNPHVLDQWFNTTSNILYEWATDGINFFWEEIGISITGAPLTDAPFNGITYERKNATWVADPIQTDAVSDGKIYVRNNANWIPDPLQVDAPADGQFWGRQNNSWGPVTGSGTGIQVFIGDTPPSNPQIGWLWWDSVRGQLYIYYTDPNSSQWVVANNTIAGPPGPIGPAGSGAPSLLVLYDLADVWLTAMTAGQPAIQNTAFTANTMYLVPLIVPAQRTFTTYMIMPVSPALSVNVNMAVYNANANGKPTTVVAQGTPMNTSNLFVFTGVFNATLAAGIYYIAFWSDGAQTVKAYPASTLLPVMGMYANAGGGLYQPSGLTYSLPYSTTFPDLTSQTYLAISNNPVPLVGIA